MGKQILYSYLSCSWVNDVWAWSRPGPHVSGSAAGEITIENLVASMEVLEVAAVALLQYTSKLSSVVYCCLDNCWSSDCSTSFRLCVAVHPYDHRKHYFCTVDYTVRRMEFEYKTGDGQGAWDNLIASFCSYSCLNCLLRLVCFVGIEYYVNIYNLEKN